MPLYNLEYNRVPEEDKTFLLNKSQHIILLHDQGPIINESINTIQKWNPSVRRHVGFLDCSNNPPFPEAHDGEMFSIIGDGTVGNFQVYTGDCIECIAEYSPEGYDAEIRQNWLITSIKGQNSNKNPNT